MFAGTIKQKWEELHLHEKPPKEGIEKTMDFLKYIINASGEIQSDSTTLISSYVFSHRNNILVALFLLENWGNSDATFPTLLELKKTYPLERSDAWKIMIDKRENILEMKRISFVEGSSTLRINRNLEPRTPNKERF